MTAEEISKLILSNPDEAWRKIQGGEINAPDFNVLKKWVEKKFLPFIKFAWKVKKLRDAVAHQRFDDLKYDGLDLSDRKAQYKFLIDLTKAFSDSAKS